jgi:hypothetical protein
MIEKMMVEDCGGLMRGCELGSESQIGTRGGLKREVGAGRGLEKTPAGCRRYRAPTDRSRLWIPPGGALRGSGFATSHAPTMSYGLVGRGKFYYFCNGIWWG